MTNATDATDATAPAALLLELEGLVFDTHAVRADALHAALAAEGVPVAWETVLHAHAGTSADRALDALAAAKTLDATGRMLVLRRAADAAARAFETEPPALLPGAADALERLAGERRVGVVTHAPRELADDWLERTELVAWVRVLRSTHDLDAAARVAVWREGARRLRLGLDARTPVLALVPGTDADDARAAGLAALRTRPGASLARLTDDVIAALIDAAHGSTPHDA